MSELKRFRALFYRTAGDREVVREWFQALSRADKKAVGDDLQKLEYGWPIGMPLTKSMGSGLHELRSDLPCGRISRVLFFVARKNLILVHAFIKKTQKTPKPDLELAKRRKRDWERNG